MAKKKDHSSKSHPSLERAPGKADNWLEKAGGLPPYIERIAKHLHSDKGMTISHAIATAVNTVKRWCQGGTVSKTSGPEKSEGVTPQTKAKACAAVAQWNAKKAKAGVNAGMDRDAYSDEDFVLELSQEIEDSMAWSLHLSAEEDADIEEIIEEDPETYELTEEEANEFDMDAYEQHLAQKRQGDGLDLAIFKWDPAKHPRNLLGQFREVLKTMDNGDAMELPDGTTIQKNGVGKYRRFNVHGGKSGEIKQNLRLEQVEEEVDLEIAESGQSRWATVGDEGGLDYFDTREEAERVADDLGGEVLEIPENDRKYRVVDERMEVYTFNTKAEAMEQFGPSIKAGEASLDEPYSSPFDPGQHPPRTGEGKFVDPDLQTLRDMKDNEVVELPSGVQIKREGSYFTTEDGRGGSYLGGAEGALAAAREYGASSRSPKPTRSFRIEPGDSGDDIDFQDGKWYVISPDRDGIDYMEFDSLEEAEAYDSEGYGPPPINAADAEADLDSFLEHNGPDDEPDDESNQEADQEIWDIVEQANPDPDRYDMEGSGDPFRYEVYDNETDNEFSLEATEDAVLDIGGYPYDWIMSVGSEDGETAQEITAGGGPEGIRRLVENFWKYVEANADWSGG